MSYKRYPPALPGRKKLYGGIAVAALLLEFLVVSGVPSPFNLIIGVILAALVFVFVGLVERSS